MLVAWFPEQARHNNGPVVTLKRGLSIRDEHHTVRALDCTLGS